jgi:hypothetical protein
MAAASSGDPSAGAHCAPAFNTRAPRITMYDDAAGFNRAPG